MSPVLSKYRGLAGVGLWLALAPATWPQQPQSQTRPQPPPVAAAAIPEAPQILFQDLYRAVQSAQLFADSKTFADAIPKFAPEEILTRYREAKPVSPEALKSFVAANFSMPGDAATPADAAPAAAKSTNERASITGHIDSLWDQLTRSTKTAPRYSSLLPLPEPYVVPGGRFREMYYWDS